MPEEQKTAVVDVIMQRTLADIDLDSSDLSERLIALACGHIFTVETLDGHCQMPDFYEVDELGRYTATKAPPVGYQLPPCCPTCRGPITALRYGRINKRATLDTLEQNVASTMSKALEDISAEIQDLSTTMQTSQDLAKKIEYKEGFKPEHDFEQLSLQRTKRFGKEDEPLPFGALSQANMVSMHGLSGEEARAWIKVVRDLVKVYRKTTDVAMTRGPHIRAYDAAFSTLYDLELADIASDAARASNAPEALALAEVKKKIGQPPHKADTRFQMEAFFLSLELRYMVAQIAKARAEGLAPTRKDAAAEHHARLWHSFTLFVYESCVRDARKAFSLAENSVASRFRARAQMYILRSNLELFRFDLLARRAMHARQNRLTVVRSQLIAEIAEHRDGAQSALNDAELGYLRLRRAPRANVEAEREWFRTNCRARGEKFLEEYDGLAAYVARDTFYEPVSLQEKADIVRAFDFGISVRCLHRCRADAKVTCRI